MSGLAVLKPEGSISMVVPKEQIEDDSKYAINNAKDKLIMFCAKDGMVPEFTTHDLCNGTQVIAHKRTKR